MTMQKIAAMLALALTAGVAFAGSGNIADKDGSASWSVNGAAAELGSYGAARDMAACKSLIRNIRKDRSYGDDVKHGEPFAQYGLAVLGEIRFHDADYSTDFAYHCLTDKALWDGGSLYGTKATRLPSLQRWQDWHAEWKLLKPEVQFAASALTTYYAEKASGADFSQMPAGYPLPTTDEQAKRLEKVLVDEVTELLDRYPLADQGWFSQQRGVDYKSLSKQSESADFLKQIGVKK